MTSAGDTRTVEIADIRDEEVPVEGTPSKWAVGWTFFFVAARDRSESDHVLERDARQAPKPGRP